jgi:hypothetical protein
MLTPFSTHTRFVEEYEKFIGGECDPLGLATLTFTTVVGAPVIVPVTHTEIVTGFELIPGGQSPKTFVERCEFRASLINFTPTKGLWVTLTVNQKVTPFAMQLWDGGLEEGGEIYRFRLVDQNYSA